MYKFKITKITVITIFLGIFLKINAQETLFSLNNTFEETMYLWGAEYNPEIGLYYLVDNNGRLNLYNEDFSLYKTINLNLPASDPRVINTTFPVRIFSRDVTGKITFFVSYWNIHSTDFNNYSSLMLYDEDGRIVKDFGSSFINTPSIHLTSNNETRLTILRHRHGYHLDTFITEIYSVNEQVNLAHTFETTTFPTGAVYQPEIGYYTIMNNDSLLCIYNENFSLYKTVNFKFSDDNTIEINTVFPVRLFTKTISGKITFFVSYWNIYNNFNQYSSLMLYDEDGLMLKDFGKSYINTPSFHLTKDNEIRLSILRHRNGNPDNFTTEIYSVNEQINLIKTFEATYQNPGAIYNPEIGYYTIINNDGFLCFYNEDFTLYKRLKINLPNAEIQEVNGAYPVRLFSKNIFTNNNKITFFVTYIDNGTEDPNMYNSLLLFDEDGFILNDYRSAFIVTPSLHTTSNDVNRLLVDRYKYVNPSDIFTTEVYGIFPEYAYLNIGDNKHTNKQLAYPNPANVTVTLPYQLMGGEISVMRIYNVNGQLIESKQIDSAFNKILLNVTNYSKGVYIYEVNGVSNRFTVY